MRHEGSNIYQRINAIMRAVTYVQKDASISGGGATYKAVTYDALLSVLRPQLVEHGVIVLVDQQKSKLPIMRDVEKGVKMHLYTGWYTVRLLCDDKPEDCMEVRVEAHAADNGDKAPGKCLTYATKAALLKIFSLETGENEEKRGGGDDKMTRLGNAVRDNFDAIQAIKNGLIESPDTASGFADLESAAEAWFDLDDDAKTALWVAPTKGGCFSTKERGIIKTSAFRIAHFGPEAAA